MLSTLLNGVTEKIGNNLYVFFSKKISDFSNEIKLQDKDFYRNFSESYLEKFKSVYYIKTLINAENGKYLYDIYVPMHLSHANNTIDQDIQKIEQISKKAFISGVGGMGKSISLKKLFLDTITQQEDIDWKIPIFIELRNLLVPKKISANENFFEDYVLSFFIERNLELSTESVRLLLNDGRITFLLDGLDEVKSDSMKLLRLSLDKFIKKFNMNTYIISSRPSHTLISWSDFTKFDVCPLTKEQAIKLIEISYSNSKLKQRFKDSLSNHYFDQYKEIAEIPLLLLIMFQTYTYNGDIPRTTSEFYAKAFSTMFYTHDSSKDESFTREKRTKLSQADFAKVFESMCFFSYLDEIYSFDEYEFKEYVNRGITSLKKYNSRVDVSFEDYAYDILNVVCFLIKENEDYRFIHRSFQEYYAAEFIKQFPDRMQQDFFSKFYEEDFEVDFEGEDGFLFFLKEIDRDRYIHNFVYTTLKDIVETFNEYSDVEYDLYLKDNISSSYISTSEYYFYKYSENKATKEFFELIGNKPAPHTVADTAQRYMSKIDQDIPNSFFGNKEVEKAFVEEVIKKDIILFTEWIDAYEEILRKNRFNKFGDFLSTI